MGRLSDFFDRWTASRRSEAPPFPAPWAADRVALYAFLRERLAGRDDLPADGGDLPDEKDRHETGGIGWAPGALDGVFTHHARGDGKTRAAEIFQALQDVCAQPTQASMARLYALIEEDSVTGYADELLTLIRAGKDIVPARLFALVDWLARAAPDRGAVKFAIVLLGLFDVSSSTELLRTFGRHDEFTLFAAVALANILPEDQREATLFDLARHVHGWGRIHVVERLVDTENAEIKNWMLREGYSNAVMYEYLAWICAKTGDLAGALAASEIDAALVKGAGEIISALIRGGPANDMSDYRDGARATRLFVEHLRQRTPGELGDFLALDCIKKYAEGISAKASEDDGWSAATCREISQACADIETRPQWRDMALEGLAAKSDLTFANAAEVAQALGIDAWSHRFSRQQTGQSDQWYYLMKTDDPARIDQVLELARVQIDLKKIASGAGLALGFGPGFKDHGALDFILPGLDHFPGKGFDMIEAGLFSPVVRNRNLALRTLDQWPREQWPAPARPALEAALEAEPDPGVRTRLGNVLAGRPLE